MFNAMTVKKGDRKGKKGKRQKSKKAPVNESEVAALKITADKIRNLDDEIQSAQKESMANALAAGELLSKGKEELKRLKIRCGFENWIANECHIPYKRGYNYKRLYEATLENPALKKMGLTEAYVQLRLVKRKPARTPDADVQNPADAATNAAAAITNPTTSPVRRTLATKYEVVKTSEAYVLEVADDWQDTVLDVFTDIENCTAVLKDGGLLLRLKQSDVGEDAGIVSVR